MIKLKNIGLFLIIGEKMKPEIKEDVLIELIEYDNNVNIIPYDVENETVIGTSIETTSRQEAFEIYNVIGEVYNGEVKLFSEDDKEFYEEDE